MEEAKQAPDDDSSIYAVAAPLATCFTLLTFFLAISLLEGRSLGGDYLAESMILSFSLLLSAIIGRILPSMIPLESSGLRISSTAITIALFALLANLVAPMQFDNLLATSFILVGFVTCILIEKERLEESSLFLSVILGMHLSVPYASGLTILEPLATSTTIDAERLAIGSAFFTFLFCSIALGNLVMVCIRGSLEKLGSGKIFSAIPVISDNKEPAIYSFAVFFCYLIPLIWMGQLSDLEQFSDSRHLGVVWASFSSLVVFIHAFCRAEGWHVLGAVIVVNWIIFTIGRLHEIGNEIPSIFSDSGIIGSFSWFFIWFWLNFFTIMAASRGRFGDIAPRREPSAFRTWWADNSYSILIGLALFTALIVRSAWNVIPAMNAAGTGLWDMTGGSDPWYMKRVVDYVIAERSHLIFDSDRSYPVGGINPRPPLFSWSLALGGIGLSWLLEIPVEEAVWWSMAALPAIYGALIILPIAGISTRVHSRTAGIFSAWLIALMPGHISRSTFAMTDHDSFAMLFLALSFYFWIRAISSLEQKNVFEKAESNPLYILAGMRQTWRNNPTVMANATLSGVCFSIMALGWKGFVYGPGILFLAYSAQVAINIFRRRDSLEFTSAALQMMLTVLVLPFPFYAWPGMNLLFDPSGMQPMFYIIGFTFAVGWVASSFRDKPWLLVIITGTVLFGSILTALFFLQEAGIYNGWDILFTGGFYFSKNKIFGTIGEAQAPSRGVLFASYGPVVALIAIGCGMVLLFRGARKNKPSNTLLGLWVIIATYMAWTAGRFIINATPAMAVVGGIGIAMMWNSANFSRFSKVWRISGIGTPRARFRSVWSASKSTPGIPAILLVLLMVSSQHATYGIDSGIPRNQDAAYDVDLEIYNIAPDILREDFFNLFSVMNSREYSPGVSGLWYMGTFGPSFNGHGWNDAYDWLSQQDSDVEFSHRPAFVSWWDYGFQALASGQHPTVADNFQTGIPESGGMLLAAGQEETLALFIATLAAADRFYNSGELSDEFTSVLNQHLEPDQVAEFQTIVNSRDTITSATGIDIVRARSLGVIAEYNDVELLRGFVLESSGIPSQDENWLVYENGVQVGNSTSDQSTAMSLFNQTRASSSPFEISEPTHYYIGGSKYTQDLMDDYYDLSTNLHRSNARLALVRAFLSTALDIEGIAGIYDGITSIEYDVQNFGASTGSTTTRNHEIRYFAVDNRLYPLGGSYYGDYNYHRGQATGIFHAPTRLSGLDLDTYISTLYQTQRGDGPIIPRSQDQYEQEYLDDIVRQSAGSLGASEVIRMLDIDYQHQPEFFETMIARIYVGYGSSTLGLQGDAENPSVWINPQQTGVKGAPDSYLENAFALPGAMMNHFVISNWYDNEECEVNETGAQISSICGTVYDSNRFVKVVKYYSGATIQGTVELEGVGPIPNARILIERDAFSGDEEADSNGEVVDRDNRTYWIPIGSTQADENGHYSFRVPAGKIRVSAFTGDPDLDSARSMIMSADVGNTMYELFTESNSVRKVNPVTGILGNVYGSTWLSESIVNISSEDGHSNGRSTIESPILVQPSSASGILSWTGAIDFDKDPVINANVILTPSSPEVSIEPYVLPTSNGTVVGDSLEFTGRGEVTFTGQGFFNSIGVATLTDFTGNHSMTILDNHSVTGEGQFSGKGSLVGELLNLAEPPSCQGSTVPQGSEACSIGENEYLINGSVDASGRYTSEGESLFTRSLSKSTFTSSGKFEVDTSTSLDTYGTINGSGSFSGEGIFSGQMVTPGSFHVTDALPGEYQISVDFGNGSVVEIGTTIEIGVVPNGDENRISIAGGSIEGSISDSEGAALSSPIFIFPSEESRENSTVECSDLVSSPCYVIPDEDGHYSIGPIIPGEYLAEIDVDDDGFPEVSQPFTFLPLESQTQSLPNVIPRMFDLSFTLTDDGNPVNDLEIVLRSENTSQSPIAAIFDNDSMEYKVELSIGSWILNHTIEGEKQIWQRIDVIDQNQNGTYQFQTSKVVNGTVLYQPTGETGLPGQPMEFQEVTFQWDGFTHRTMTDDSGEFSVTLPENAEVDATVEILVGIEGFYSNGTKFTVSAGMDDVIIDVVDSFSVIGTVNLNREGYRYVDEILGWVPITVTATSPGDEASDASWTKPVSPSGTFEMLLPKGNWTFALNPPGDLGVSSSVELEINKSSDLDLILFKELNSTVFVDFFIDHSKDNNISNGTPVQYPFEISPVDPNGLGYSVARNGSEWVADGRAEVSLEPGSYRIVVERANASAGEEFDTLYDFNEIFQVGMDSEIIVEREVGFEPLWLFSAKVTNRSFGNLSDHEVTFENVERGWIQKFYTNENGTIAEYLSEGEWVIVIEEFETSDGIFEGLRERVNISEENAGTPIDLRTDELAEVAINLQMLGMELQSPGSMDISFNSQEGLGSFNAQSNSDGETLVIRLPSGFWNIQSNQTDADGVRLLVANTSLSESGLSAGGNYSIDVTVNKQLQLTGKVYWDLDDNGNPGVLEGIANVSVNLTEEGSLESNYSLMTNQMGQWSVFLPTLTNWNISVEKEGFSPIQSNVSIFDSSIVEDIEISAGVVDVSGSVSYISEDWIFGEDWDVVLIPEHGVSRERVTPEKSGNEWNSSVEPGRWIVYITANSSGTNLVSIDSMVVDIQGGEVTSVLTAGGTLVLDTEWLDYNGTSKSLMDVSGDYDLEISTGPGISWSENLGLDGILRIVLPAGRVDASSEFAEEQRGREMTFSGGQGVTISAGQESPTTTLRLERVSKQDISISDLTASSLVVGLNDSCIMDSDCDYKSAEFSMRIDYDGHNPFDSYSVTASVAGIDGALWKVEFQNSTGSWNDSATFDLGLDNAMSIENFKVRVTPANKSNTHHFANGHDVSIFFSTADGYSTEHKISVNVPIITGFKLADEFVESTVFFTSDQRQLQVSIPYSNLGNGDNLLNFSYEIAGWEAAGPQIQPIAPFSNGTTTLILSHDGSEKQDEYVLEITVSDSSNESTKYQIYLEKDAPELSIVGKTIQLTSGGKPVIGREQTYVVEVTNDGNVIAEGVTLHAKLCADIKCRTEMGVNSSATNDIDGLGKSMFYIPMDFTNFSKPDTYFILFEIIPPGMSEEDELEACTSSRSEVNSFCVLEAQLWSEAEEGIQNWMAYLFIAILLGILWAMTRRPGRKSAAPF